MRKISKLREKKDRETKRKEDFEKLQSSEKRQEELLTQQSDIDALQAELENANRAQRLLPEKREFDNAKSELEKSEESLRGATAEKTEAEARVEDDQNIYEEKETGYQIASKERDQKMPVYTAAKSDVERASERFAEADKRTPELMVVNNQINVQENQLTDRQTQQTELQKQIDDTQRFLEDNPLPSDRQPSLNRVIGLLAELTSYEQQLETEQTNKANAEKRVSSLKKEIEKFSKTQEEHLSEKALTETTLADATTQLNELLTTGTLEEWTDRKQQATQAYPIIQESGEMLEDLKNLSDRASALSDTVSARGAELVQIEAELQEQTEMCQHVAKAG